MALIDSRLARGSADMPRINAPEDGTSTEPDAPIVETNGDWHDQVKSASRLLLMAMDRLGLEERHENLANSSPLYKKVSSAVFPPLKASLNYIHGQIDPEHANSEYTGTVAELEDDVASPASEHQGSTLILSMLATASAFAGSTSLKAIGKILNEHNRISEDDPDELYSSETELGAGNINGANGSADNQFDNQYEAVNLSRNSSQNVPMRRTSTSGSMGQSMRKTPTLATINSGNYSGNYSGNFSENSDETKLMYSTEIMAKAFSNDEYRPPPENLRSVWENSVMANHSLNSTRDHGLIRYEASPHDDLNSDSPEKVEILKYHIALKLRETFDFDDDNYLYNRFDCWLVKDVLLQGHMYITRDAVCFYSLLPGKFSATELTDPELTLHAGAVGHKLAHYGDAYFSSVYTNRFWAVLKPQTLSIYTSPTKLYFPVRTIDLRQAISCEIEDSAVVNTQSSPVHSPHLSQTPTDPSLSQLNSEMSSMVEEEAHDENVQAGVWFKITCTDKTYRFHTSSIYSARHWYNSISKAIFLIHNTNHQHEVIMRVPTEDIVDYKKNFVLSEVEAAESELPDEDSPMAFSLQFSVPPETENSRIERLKMKRKKSRGRIHDSAHFVVFTRGQELGRTFEQSLEENVLRDSAKNSGVRKKTKMFFREDRADSLSSLTKPPQRAVTTVQPDFTSTQSVIEKILQFNTKIMQAREKELAKVADDQSISSLYRGNDTDKRFGYMPSFKGMKDKLLPKSMTNSGVATPEDDVSEMLYDDDSMAPPEDFVLPDFDLRVQLPRPFSLDMLKNLDVQMVRKMRSFDDIASQYGALSELLRARQAKEKALVDSIAEEDNVEEDNVEDTDSQTAYSESQANEDSEKSGKLRIIKNSLRSVSTMGGVWSAKPEHYDRSVSHDRYYVGNNRVKIRALNHFRNHFSLGPDSHLVSTYHAHLKRTLPVFGRLYVGKDQLCFRSKIPGVSTKMVLPLRDIQSCKKSVRSYRYAGLVLRIRGLDDLQFSFGSRDARDDCQKMILKLLRREEHFHPDIEFQQDNDSSSSIEIDESDKQTKRTDELAMTRVHAARLSFLEDKISYATGIDMPLILEDNPFTTTEVKLAKCYKITLLTIGSRGDVQPYIALGKALLKEGHEVTIATHHEFREWIEKHKIHFKEIAGDPAELMSLMVTHGSISVGFLKEASSKFRGWIGELLESSWKACQGAELLIESPSAMAGLHIAEALNIPYMRAFTMPWTRTKAYPHAFLVPDQNRGGSYNFLTHVMFENVFWKGISGQVNRWREETLHLPRTSLVKMHQSRVPFLYNVSPALFPPSVDFPDWVKVTGYWFLDEGSDEYDPPKELVTFLETAKENAEKVVYIGFGSIVVSDAKALTKTIVEAVVDSGVKCILNKGWSDRSSKSKDNPEPEVELPPQVYDAGMIPHDWLFPRIDAAVHHGGSGTTGATLRSGLPTIIKPFFGDQFFFASRVEDLGVGIALKQLNRKSFTKALKSIVSEDKYTNKATEIAREMSHERGVLSAIEAIYTELAYAKSLVSVIRNESEQRRNTDDKSGAQTPVADEDSEDTDEGDEEYSEEEADESSDRDETMSDALGTRDGES